MTLRNNRRARVLLLSVIGTCVLGASGCAETTSPTSTTAPSGSVVDNTIDPMSLDRVMDVVAEQNLPVTGRHDVTGQVCPTAGCTSAMAADQLTVLHFPATGRAEIYAGSQDDAFQILDIVVTFPDSTPVSQRDQYREAVKLAVR